MEWALSTFFKILFLGAYIYCVIVILILGLCAIQWIAKKVWRKPNE